MLKSLNSILSTIENQPLLQRQQQLQEVRNYWTQVVSEAEAQHTRPHSISQDILEVATASSVWVQDLKFKRPLILKQLNGFLSSPLVEIRFSTAHWHQEVVLPSSVKQEHPSQIPQDPPSVEVDPSDQPKDPYSAFQQWAAMIQARSQSLPLCPQCQCPTPPGELRRWRVCALCAAKQGPN